MSHVIKMLKAGKGALLQSQVVNPEYRPRVSQLLGCLLSSVAGNVKENWENVKIQTQYTVFDS